MISKVLSFIHCHYLLLFYCLPTEDVVGKKDVQSAISILGKRMILLVSGRIVCKPLCSFHLLLRLLYIFLLIEGFIRHCPLLLTTANSDCRL